MDACKQHLGFKKKINGAVSRRCFFLRYPLCVAYLLSQPLIPCLNNVRVMTHLLPGVALNSGLCVGFPRERVLEPVFTIVI